MKRKPSKLGPKKRLYIPSFYNGDPVAYVQAFDRGNHFVAGTYVWRHSEVQS